MRSLLVLSALACASASSSTPTTPAEMQKKMGIGINLGNTLDAPTEGAWAPKAEESFFDEYKVRTAGRTRWWRHYPTHPTPRLPYVEAPSLIQYETITRMWIAMHTPSPAHSTPASRLDLLHFFRTRPRASRTSASPSNGGTTCRPPRPTPWTRRFWTAWSKSWTGRWSAAWSPC